MSRGHPRLTVRVDPDLLERVEAAAQAQDLTVSDVLRKAVTTYAQDVGPEAVLVPLTPHYHAELLKRLQNYPGRRPREVMEHLLQLALDGEWF